MMMIVIVSMLMIMMTMITTNQEIARESFPLTCTFLSLRSCSSWILVSTSISCPTVTERMSLACWRSRITAETKPESVCATVQYMLGGSVHCARHRDDVN
jgi:hypothetical protein